jgi:hypothetical protein
MVRALNPEGIQGESVAWPWLGSLQVSREGLAPAQMELHSWHAFRRMPDFRIERTAATERF